MTLSQFHKVPKNTRALNLLNLKIIVENKTFSFSHVEDRDSFISKHYSQLKLRLKIVVKGAE